MGRIDDEAVRLFSFAGKSSENAVEHTHPAPTDKAIVKRFVGAVFFWCVAPAESIFDHENNPADDTMIVNARHTMRTWKIRLDATELFNR